MKKIKLKVCGMRDPKNMMDVASTSPDFMGFIFYARSKRFVGQGFSLPKDFPATIKRVGVFVNESVERISDLVQKHQLDYLQLHGDESVESCKMLRERTKIIKVFRVDDHFDFDQIITFEGNADYFMFDTKSLEYGGSGKSFDWSILKKYNQRTPFFLSGGLSINNVPNITELKDTNLFAVDINSGAEIAPGIKDPHIVNNISNILNSFPYEIHS